MMAFDRKLFDAVMRQDKTEIERLLHSGADLNAVYYDERGIEDNDHIQQTLFSMVLDESKFALDYVLWLIKKGAKPTSPNGHTDNPLYWAVWDLKYWLCHLLLNNGTDPNNWVVSPGGRQTPLDHLAERQQYTDEGPAGTVHLISAIRELLESHGAVSYSDLENKK